MKPRIELRWLGMKSRNTMKMRSTKEMEWALPEWKRLNIPCWQRIYNEALLANDFKRAEYAQKLLKEIGGEDENRN
jgi:hypothetical protein